MRGSGATVAAAVAAVAALGGCSGKGAAEPGPATALLPPSAVPTAAAASTAVSATAVPDIPGRKATTYPATKDGAYALGHDFWLIQNADISARVTADYDSVTTSSCVCARDFAKAVARLIRDDVHYQGEVISIERVDGYAESGASARIAVTFTDSSGTIVGATGKVIERTPGLRARDVLSLVPLDGHWRVDAITRVLEKKL